MQAYHKENEHIMRGGTVTRWKISCKHEKMGTLTESKSENKTKELE